MRIIGLTVFLFLHRQFGFGRHSWAEVTIEPQFDPENTDSLTAKRVSKRCRYCSWKQVTLQSPDYIEPGAVYKWPNNGTPSHSAEAGE